MESHIQFSAGITRIIRARAALCPRAYRIPTHRVWLNAKVGESARALQQLRNTLSVKQIDKHWATRLNFELEDSSPGVGMSGCRIQKSLLVSACLANGNCTNAHGCDMEVQDDWAGPEAFASTH